MNITVADIYEIIDEIPLEERKRWKGLTFVIDNEAIVTDENGAYVVGQYQNAGIITIYPYLVRDKKHLKEVLIHEIAHHFGLRHGELPGII